MSPRTAVLLIDPLNDFLHPDGKLYPLVKASLESSNSLEHMQQLVAGARQARIPIFYGLHQITKDGTYSGWNHMNGQQIQTQRSGTFSEEFGGQILNELEPQPSNGDVVVSRHWISSSFANTDLEYQLRQHDITHVVLAGLTTNSCVESTARAAREIGFHVTLLTDATAAFSVELEKAAVNLVWPTFADQLLSTNEPPEHWNMDPLQDLTILFALALMSGDTTVISLRLHRATDSTNLGRDRSSNTENPNYRDLQKPSLGTFLI
ncbi:Isochorismatase-like protein [Penicillium verhagenii]|uniref:Isochorismatase-like protein n=1 Tax=Penicillium verhagenii TaxID=1562060 RepID=UPI002545A170|nr:Isochorismatase-like protein [Penicillium verhagenii]KAJ5917240.1 Isochorismatase-like protein [Penicillium verhagenii]